MARLKLRDKWHKAALPVIIYTFLMMLPTFAASILSIDELKLLPSRTVSIIQDVVSVYQILITGALSMGLATLSLKIIRGYEFSTGIIFTGFQKYGQSFCTGFLVTLFTTLWACLFALPGILLMTVGSGMTALGSFTGYAFIFLGVIVTIIGLLAAFLYTLRYSMTFLLVSDNKTLRASEAVKHSVAMMRENSGNLFMLLASFLGWIILALLPLYISVLLSMMTEIYPQLWPLIIILSFISFVAYAYVLLYISTAKAVFYSGLSGNFRINIDGIEDDE
jgi:uncharacterized membrane protein